MVENRANEVVLGKMYQKILKQILKLVKEQSERYSWMPSEKSVLNYYFIYKATS